MRIIFAVLALLCGVGVKASDVSVYVGAGGAYSDMDVSFTTLTGLASQGRLEGQAGGFKVVEGIRAFDWLAFETSYIDFGNVSLTMPIDPPFVLHADYSLKGFGESVIVSGGSSHNRYFAKIGVLRWQAGGSYTNNSCYVGPYYTGPTFVPNTCAQGSFRLSESGAGISYGAGLEMRRRRVAARFQYERFNVAAANRVAAFSVDVVWSLF